MRDRESRKRRTRLGQGRLAQRVMQILEDAGYEPDCLRPAKGFWRTAMADVFSWEVHLKIDGFVKCCGCWQTMTQFVKLAGKYGFTVDDDEIWANQKPREEA